jgi:hypothetical protein
MRPFPEDLYWYEIDPVSYDAEFNRKSAEYEEQYNEHMAKFNKPYKLTRSELTEKIKDREFRVKRLKELKAPDIIVENEQRLLTDLTQKWASNDYLKTDADRIYRKRYEDHQKKFKFEWAPDIPPHIAKGIKARLIEEGLDGERAL